MIRTARQPSFCHLALAFALFALALSTAARAASFCVATGDALKSALSTAATNGADDQVRVTGGLKTVTSGSLLAWVYGTEQDFDLQLSGGWNAGCTLQTGGPRATVLDGGGERQVMRILHHAASTGTAHVSNLTLRNGHTQNNGGTGGLDVLVLGSAAPLIVVERLVVRENDAPSSSGAVTIQVADGASGQVTMRNNMIEANGQPGLLVSLASSTATAYVSHNTITGNAHVGNGTSGLVVAGGGATWITNNAIAGNASADMAIQGSLTATLLRNNFLGTPLVGTPGSQLGTQVGDPRWALDGLGYWRPLADSPLVDSGWASPAGGSGASDLHGEARLYGGALDRGAREMNDTVFAHGYQLN